MREWLKFDIFFKESNAGEIAMYQLLMLPVISAFIGYITNVVAIKLLFWPREPVNLLFFELYGVLPKRRMDIARSAGEMVEEKLLSLDDLFDKIDTPEVREDLIDRLRVIIKARLGSMMPGFVPDKVTRMIEDVLDRIIRQEADDIVRQVIQSGQEYLNKEVKVKQIVEDRINQLDLQQLEEMIREIASTELKFIEVLGGVLGFIIGLVQVAILLVFPL